MAGLTSSLFASAQALSAQSQGIEVTGKNLANLNTVGYARQRVILGDRGEVISGGQTLSMGVEALGVGQIRDQLLDRRVVRETSATAGLAAAQSVLTSAESAIGLNLSSAGGSAAIATTDTGAGGGISDALGDFFNAFESFSAQPGNVGERQLLLQKASILVEKINTADQRLEQVQTDVNTQVATDVSDANDILGEIAHLNQLIGAAENGKPGSAVDLRDQRQVKLESLAQYFNFDARSIAGSNGQIQVVAQDAAGADVILVDGNTVNGSLAFDGTNFTGGAAATVLGLSTGSLPGQVGARDGAVQTLRDNLKNLADQLTGSVNAAYNPTGTTGDFFSTTPARLIALDGTVTITNLKASDSGNSGANDLALAVATLANKNFSTASGDSINGSFSGFFNGAVTDLGQALSSTSTRLEDQQLSTQAVTAQRDSVSGTSQDEELTNLTKYQRAFQGSARFMTVVDSLLELVVTSLGSR